jgi:hypothetical protein
MTKQDIIEQAGGLTAISARVDVKRASVRVMLARGPIPASWYFALCDMTGQALPRHLFSFKGL